MIFANQLKIKGDPNHLNSLLNKGIRFKNVRLSFYRVVSRKDDVAVIEFCNQKEELLDQFIALSRKWPDLVFDLTAVSNEGVYASSKIKRGTMTHRVSDAISNRHALN